MHRLLDKLHNLYQGDLSSRDYIVKFEDLSRYCDVREHCSHIITRFISGLRFDIRRAVITSSNCVDSVEDAFGFALKINFDFQGDSTKVWEQYLKCEGYEHYDY